MLQMCAAYRCPTAYLTVFDTDTDALFHRNMAAAYNMEFVEQQVDLERRALRAAFLRC